MIAAATPRRRPLVRWAVGFLLALLGLAVAAALALWLFMRASLPLLDGTHTAPGLPGAVTITRDAQGVPTLQAPTRDAAAWATGFVHAQERYFQMDLLRRAGAGELAALVGAKALPVDRERRLHRMRARAQAALRALPPADAALLAHYTSGVNAGLAALGARPPEYALLRQTPAPWQAEDALLVVAAMGFDLQGNLLPRELARGWLAAHASTAQLLALLPEASRHDAPVDAQEVAAAPAPWPASAPVWFAQPASAPVATTAALDLATSVGSNNWALAGARTPHGAAILANDMHLGLRLPNIWYRAVIAVEGAPRLVGVTLPGAPLLVAGSNGQVAWGYTNSYADLLDLVAPQGPVTTHEERIVVAGGADVPYTVREAANGPLVEAGGQTWAVQWVMHAPGAISLGLRGMEAATTLEAAQAVGNAAGMPAQNLLVATRDGRIGWTLAGRLPARAARWADTFPGATGWAGLREPSETPRVMDPQAGFLATANSRTLAGADYARLGDGGNDLGARGRQIRGALAALPPRVDEPALFVLGLDDRALFMAGWRERALAVLDAAALQGQPARAEYRRLLQDHWSGHASVDDVGYRLTRAYLYALYGELFGGVDAQLKAVDAAATFARAATRWPAVIERLLDEQPAGWLPPGRSWRELQLAAIDRAIAGVQDGHEGGYKVAPGTLAGSPAGTPLAQATWGARNTSRIAHPFAALLPGPLARALTVPPLAMAGDEHMPRVAAPQFGASERLVVAPGHEEQALFTMPGGQSGHPLSPYFLAGHDDWAAGRPRPLLPGPTVYTLTLRPTSP